MTTARDPWIEKYVLPVLLLMAGAVVSGVAGAFGIVPIAFGLLVAVVLVVALRLYRAHQEIRDLKAQVAQSDVAKAEAGALRATVAQLASEKTKWEGSVTNQLNLSADLKEANAQLVKENSRLRRQLDAHAASEPTPVPVPSARDLAQVREALTSQLKQVARLRKAGHPVDSEQRRKVELWRARTLAVLRQAFGDDARQVEEFEELEFEAPPMGILGIFDRDEYQRDLDAAEALLRTALEFELPSNGQPGAYR